MSGPGPSTTRRVEIELEVSRDEHEPQVLTIAAPAATTTGDALDALAGRLDLRDAEGTVQAISLVGDSWLDRSVPLGGAGLLRGERLRLTVGLRPGGQVRPPTRWRAPAGRPDENGRVHLNRPPRAVHAPPSLTLHVPTKRRLRPPRRFPLGAMLIPVGIGVLLVIVVRRWEIALFSLFTPVMVWWNHVEEKRARRDELAEYGRTYEEECTDTLAAVDEVTRQWTAWLRECHPDVDRLTTVVAALDPRLWCRQPGDPDFLGIRVGTARRRAPVTLQEDHGATRADRDERPDYEGAAHADGVPVVVDLGACGALALVGDADLVRGAGSWVVAQLAALHSPEDVELVMATADGDLAASWRWLPHLAHDLAPVSAVVTDHGSAEELLAHVAAVGAARRRAAAALGGHRGPSGRLLVVVVDDALGCDPATTALLVGLHDVGILTVWLGTDRRAVPTAAPVLLDLRARDEADLVAHRGGDRVRLAPELLPRSTVIDLCAQLAPLQDAGAGERSRAVPPRVALEDLVADLASPLAMRQRWEEAPADALVARIGRSSDRVVTLDLGPSGSHVLVGGTTGSGKSELLQTLVASLAADYPPSRVGFLLVDYKGGAAFKDATHLPHSVGVVTDLDEHLTRRVLHALDAEIRRREVLLAAGGARDLTELRRTAPRTAPGDLLIVVDEFAALAKEVPDFVEGVVDIAARGRSLGLRLVLATQRPAGVINDRIRANVGARIALRVNDEADSQDVIGDRRAAHIGRNLPGRALLRVHRDLVEFQSAFVGAPLRGGAGAFRGAVEVYGGPEDPGPRDLAGLTALEAVVACAQRVAALGAWPPPHVPWLPALPDVVELAELQHRSPDLPGIAAPIALADLPARQSQQVTAFDLEVHQNLLVFGTSRSGKTTALRTIAAGLAQAVGPERLTVYGLDFAGHGLHVLDALPHCAGIVGPGDPGRIARLVRRLDRLLTERSDLAVAHRVTDFGGLAAALGRPVPRVLVLIDGYSGARSLLERLDSGRLLDRLERLIPDGPAMGLHFVITADRRAAVPSSLASVITARLVLRMAERDDYGLLGVDDALSRHARLGPGRGFVQGTTEVQVAVTARGGPDAEHAALDALARRLDQEHAHRPPPLMTMPGRVRLAHLPPPADPLLLPVAFGDEDVAPVCLDLREGHALVVGPPRSGRSGALATIAAAARRADRPPHLALLTTRRSAAEAALWDTGPVPVADAEAVRAALDLVSGLAAAGQPVVLCCDDADGLPDPVAAAVEDLVRRGATEPLRVVAAADNRWALRTYAGPVPELRKSKQALLLSPDVDLDGDLVGVRLRTPLEAMGAPGRGFLVVRGAPELVQVAQADPEDHAATALAVPAAQAPSHPHDQQPGGPP